MGAHVGAIPSLWGDRISSSRTWARCFSSMSSRFPLEAMAESTSRLTGQLMVWMPACFFDWRSPAVVGSGSRGAELS